MWRAITFRKCRATPAGNVVPCTILVVSVVCKAIPVESVVVELYL